MRNKVFRSMLQLFAEEPGGDPAPPNPDPDGKPEVTDPETPPAPEAKYTEEDLARMKKEWAKEQEKAVKDAEAEAAKLAKMNQEQKQQYALEKAQNREKELQARIEELEKEALRSSLSKEAAKTMKEDHGIIATPDMLEFVVGDDAKTTNERISKLVGIILEDRKQVEKERATGKTPKFFGSKGNTMSEIDKRIAKYK